MSAPDDIPIGGKGSYDIPGDEMPIKGGSYNIPGDEMPIKGGSYNIPGDEMPIKGGAYEIPGDEMPIKGGAYEIPGDEMPIKGGSYKVPGEEMPIKGGSYKVPDEEMPIKGGSFKAPDEEMPIKGGSFKAPDEEMPIKGGSYKVPDEEMPIKGESSRIPGEEIAIKGGTYEIPGEELPIKSGAYQIPESEVKEGDMPLASKGAYKLPELEAPEEQEKEETGPLEKRIESKNWKSRCKAYGELTNILKNDPNGPFSDYSSGLVKYISDSNPGAQEKALDLLKVYIERQPDIVLGPCEGLVKALVEKGMASAKPSIKNESTIIIQDLFSIHKDNFEAFNNGLISCLNNKNIKVQQSAMLAVNTIMGAFGAKKLSFKPFVGIIEKYAAASNPQVRGEALNFYKESFRWVRDLIKPNVEKLKKPQQDELEKAFAEITETPMPTRWLKCEEAQAKKQLEAGISVAKPLDIYEMADAKDIFTKYGEKWCNGVLAMEKWTEKKSALEELNKEADYPKLAEKSAIELVTMAKRLINDSNVNVMLQTMKMVGLLAKGQRKYFDNYAKQFLPVILQKFKDKKTLVLLEAHSSLDNLMFSLSLEQSIEDLKEALEDKTPSVKTNTCQFLERLFDKIPINETKGQAKLFATIMKKNTDDSTPDVRQAAFKLLAVLCNKCPDIVNPIIRDLPAAKMKKIEEAGGAAQGAALMNSPQPGTKAPEEKKDKAKAENPGKTGSTPTITKKEPPKATSAGKTSAQPTAKAPEKEEEEVITTISAEEAETIVTGFLPPEVLTQLKDNAWKEKQAGLQKLSEWIAENSQTVNSQNEPILRFVRSTVKDWKENNFNVVKAAIEIFKNITENYTISKRAAASVLNTTALEKLADAKLLEVYISCINSLCAVLGPRFVIGLIIKNTADSNKPKVVSECCGIIGKTITDYGPHTVNLKDVVDYAKAGLAGANPAIKKASQSLTLIVYSYLGDKLTPLLTEIKESTMKVLQEEFSKTELVQNPTFKTYKGQEAVKVVDARKALDEAMPRANIEKLLTPALLKKLTDANWKVRKEGLDEFEGILDSSGMRIIPSGLDNIIKPLVGRISDPNKSLVRQTLLLTGKLAGALGMESKNLARHFLPPIIGCFADKMNLLRADALTAVNKWAEEAGLDTIITYASGPLSIDNPELRSELLGWLLEHKDKFKENDMKPYIQGTLACLQDRTAPIRTKAESLFAEVVECVGFEAFQPFLKDIKPAVMNTLNVIFDKYKHRAPEPELSESISLPPRQSRGNKEAPQTNRSGSKEPQKPKTGIQTRISSESDLKSNIKKPDPRNSRGSIQIEISITVPGSKSKRLEQEAKCKWTVDDIRNDYQEKLKEQMRTAVTADLFTLLYHNDFKKQVEGVTFLSGLINTLTREFIEILDIIFRWVWIRFQEAANTQLIKAILEMLESLINTLIKESYKLHEIEASLFLPIICEKSGQNNVQFKNMIRSIIHNSARIYNPEKVFIFVINGCNSKNTKSKVECLEELSELVKEFGIEICLAKDVKTIAKHASSQDNNVRTAAVQTMGEIYRLKGDQVWQMMGEIPDKVKDLFDQRFRAVGGSGKRLSKEGVGSKMQTPKNKSLVASFDNSRSTTPVLPKDDSEIREPKLSTGSHDEVKEAKEIKENKDLKDSKPIRREGLGSKMHFHEGKETHKTLPPIDTHKPLSPSPEESKETCIESAKIPMINILEMPDSASPITQIKPENNVSQADIDIPNESLLYDLKRIPNESLLNVSSKLEESTCELDKHIETLCHGDMSNRVDALVAINDLVLNNLEAHKEELQKKANNLADALTKVIIITFDKPISDIPLRFAKYILNVVNKVCCTKIIMRELNETSLFALVEQILTRLLIEDLEKAGEKGEGELMLKTLNGTMLRVLEHCRPTRTFVVLIRLLTKYKSGASLQKMTGLIIRCLLKLTKIMNGLIHQIEINKLLLVMHEYLSGYKLSGVDDLGSKTIKTILTEVVKLQGASIWASYEEIRKHPVPDVHIEKWINVILNSSNHGPSSLVSPRNKPIDILSDIFSIIKQDYTKGFTQLTEHLNINPAADYSSYISTLPTELQQKLKEDLEIRLKKKDTNTENTNIGGCNLQDFKERLSMMKQRYGIATSNTQPSDVTATLDSLRSKVAKKNEDSGPSSMTEIKSRIQSLRNNK